MTSHRLHLFRIVSHVITPLPSRVIWTENGIEKESLRMRVVLNQLPTAGKKTGVGHYTEQLIYHLRELNGRHQIDCFPRSWIHQASSLFAHGRQLLGILLVSIAPSVMYFTYLTLLPIVKRARILLPFQEE